MSGEYAAVVTEATGGNLEVPGASVNSDLDWSLGSRVLAVMNSLG